MELFRFAAFAVVCAILCVVLQKQGTEQAMLLSLAGCAGLLLAAMGALSPAVQFLRRLQELAGLNAAVFAPVLKTAAIGLLTQLAEAFCRDAGQQALAKTVELTGGLLAFTALLPLAGAVTELLQRMAGG